MKRKFGILFTTMLLLTSLAFTLTACGGKGGNGTDGDKDEIPP